MGDLRIDTLDAELLDALESDAKEHGVSVSERAAELLRKSLERPVFKKERTREAYEIASMAGRKSTVDSTDMIREVRSR